MRLTPEREKEIRECKGGEVADYDMLDDLLSEIDALRVDVGCWKTVAGGALKTEHENLKLREERDLLKAAVERYEVILIDLVREGHQPVKTFAENALAEVDRILSGTGDAVDASRDAEGK